ncbi:MAG: cellulase family glycosylhydrolase [Acidobacteria bacterium]|nr:cellulase family glycosylhydrolase [Acidobacteriota bacterium]MBV9478124.1 cellulase family glycosylhydrolase [Acidobacteriota bacterium]
MTLPRRFIAYGAYNLANDRNLGAVGGGDTRNYFQYIADGGWPINLVRVWVFRRSTADTLPPDRAIHLYQPDHTINPTYLDNLELLVKLAAAKGFWVQVCLFNYHVCKFPEEVPEDCPPELLPAYGTGTTLCGRLQTFFQPSQNATTHKQKELIAAVGNRLKTKTNVLWEIGNELRMDGGGCGDVDNQNLVAWIQIMKDALVNVVGASPLITTSTGVTNESMTLRNIPFSFFDFHAGQWGIDSSPQSRDLQENILDAKRRAATYNPNAFLIINDDGVGDADRTPGAVGAWASKAFSLGLHYSTKSTYPPQPWSTHTLDQLRIANQNFPPP